MKTKIYTMLFILLMLIAENTTLYCQKDTSESREAYMERIRQNEYDKYGLTEEKLDNLNKIGIDVRHYNSTSPEMLMSAFTDAVVVVKIVAILDWPGPVEQLFHTKERACIQEVLKGKAIVGDTIELLEKSGPITGSGEADHIAVSTDGGVGLGEEAIVFLRRMNKDSYLTSGHNKKSFDLGNFRSDSTRFYVDINHRCLIKNNKCLISGKTVDVSQFKSNIKKVAAILEK